MPVIYPYIAGQSMKTRAHVYVSGRVQGVFFRNTVADLADHLNVVGWVRNLSDGRVETILEGESSNVEKIVEFCKRGPPGAYVRDLEVKWEEWRGEFTDFKILY